MCDRLGGGGGLRGLLIDVRSDVCESMQMRSLSPGGRRGMLRPFDWLFVADSPDVLDERLEMDVAELVL